MTDRAADSSAPPHPWLWAHWGMNSQSTWSLITQWFDDRPSFLSNFKEQASSQLMPKAKSEGDRKLGQHHPLPLRCQSNWRKSRAKAKIYMWESAQVWNFPLTSYLCLISNTSKAIVIHPKEWLGRHAYKYHYPIQFWATVRHPSAVLPTPVEKNPNSFIKWAVTHIQIIHFNLLTR